MFLLPQSPRRTAARRVFGLLLILFASLLGACSRPSVHEQVLDNGLRVFVKEDHRAPVVASFVWYRVGSVDEPKGITGISHVLEHMMFKGTDRLKPNEFSRIIAENGGRENAFTSQDYTAYFQQLERSRLEVAFQLEADRMRHLKLADEEFAKEIKVVMEERRLRTEDRPEARVHEKFMETAFKVHPYRHPIIGWMGDLEKMTVEDLRKWYQRFYSPRNAIVVVAGDVDPSEVFRLAKKHFGPLAAAPVERTPIPAEPPQTELRRVSVRVPAEVPYMIIGYHVPVYGEAKPDWEPYALAVLAGVLDGGNSARFSRDLVRGKKVAESVNVGYSASGRYPNLFMIDGTPANGNNLASLESAIRAQIKRLHETPVSAEELARVKAQVVAQDVYTRDSLFYQAMRVGLLETIGLSWRLIDDYVDRIRAVTPEQVQAVARKYLVDTNLTIAELDPLPGAGRHKRPSGSPHGH